MPSRHMAASSADGSDPSHAAGELFRQPAHGYRHDAPADQRPGAKRRRSIRCGPPRAVRQPRQSTTGRTSSRSMETVMPPGEPSRSASVIAAASWPAFPIARSVPQRAECVYQASCPHRGVRWECWHVGSPRLTNSQRPSVPTRLAPELTDFAAETRRLMGLRGYSQRRLALAAGIDPGDFSKMLNGIKAPTPANMARIDDILCAGGAIRDSESPRPPSTHPGIPRRRLGASDAERHPRDPDGVPGHRQPGGRRPRALPRRRLPGQRSHADAPERRLHGG